MPRIHSNAFLFVLISVAICPLALTASPKNDWRNLVFVEALFNGSGGVVSGLAGARSVAVSPDGRHVYVAGSSDHSVTVFARNSASGRLVFVEVERDGVDGVEGLNGAFSVKVSPEGDHVYVAGSGDDAVAIFSRDTSTGGLTWVEVEIDGVNGVDGLDEALDVTVSPDGKHVYVAGYTDSAVAQFDRDLITGELSFFAVAQDQQGGVNGLFGAGSVTISPDGKHVYVAGALDNAVVLFDRQSATGLLTFVGFIEDGVGFVDGLYRPTSISVSPDGKHVYVAGGLDDSVALFNRTSSSGALAYVGIVKDGVGSVEGLDGPLSVTVSSDGRRVYAASLFSNAVVMFTRIPSTGALFFEDVATAGVGRVEGLQGSAAVAVSPDGRHVYSVGRDDASLVAFLVSFTGFFKAEVPDGLPLEPHAGFVELLERGPSAIYCLTPGQCSAARW